MKRRKLLWKVYPYYLAIIVLSLILTGLYASHEMKRMYVGEITSALEARARLIGKQLQSPLVDSDKATLQRQCKELGVLTDTRITVVDRDGVVLADSEEEPESMENHGSRPEIARAYTGEVAARTRYSNTLQQEMTYVAVPIIVEGRVIAIVRTSYPLTLVKKSLSALYGNLVVVGIGIAILATVVSLLIFRRVTRPLQMLREGAERFAEGRLESKLPIPEPEEISALAESMNQMAADLDGRIRTIVEQRNEREAILSSMTEGVLALDGDEKIVSLNRAAARFLGIDIKNAIGRPVQETARIASLNDFVDRTLRSSQPTEMEITCQDERQRCLQAHGTALTDGHGRRVGIVLVFNDITRLKKLETIRRDFVANVSHELKTPITAILGSVETLLDGAIKSRSDSERFLKMIAKHSVRLNNLVDDLLSLARLESESERGAITMTRARIAEILESSVQACQEISSLNQVILKSSCAPDLEAEVNEAQIEQAVTNLIDNAVKHSDPGSEVGVTADLDGDEVVISVKDEGRGIEAKHLPRLFERFYQVDPARSRKTGGTGLGLAIVKHIALAHGGRVSVSSEVGYGSTFRIHIPRSSSRHHQGPNL